jgi:hypothetical protein
VHVEANSHTRLEAQFGGATRAISGAEKVLQTRSSVAEFSVARWLVLVRKVEPEIVAAFVAAVPEEVQECAVFRAEEELPAISPGAPDFPLSGVLFAKLAKTFYSAFKPAAQFLADFLGDPKLQEGARHLGDAIGTGLAKGVSAFGEAVGAVMGPVFDFGAELTGKVRDGIQWLLDNVPTLTEKLREHGGEYKGLAVAFGPAGVAALAVANNWDTLSEKFK